MKKYIAGKFSKKMTSLWHSWSYFDESFIEDYQKLTQDHELHRDGPYPVLWKTGQKFVLKLPASGRSVAFKSYDKLRNAYKFLFRLSPCGREGANFQLFRDLNITVPTLLAVGEVRRFRILKTAFLATEFAENYRDGRVFFEESEWAQNIALRDEFICRNLELLARCHDHNILHYAFSPYNVLFRLRDQADEQGNMLDILWIDVATCRKLPRWLLKMRMTRDHAHFFKFFHFSEEELRRYLEHYTAACQRPLGTTDEFLKNLMDALQKLNQDPR